jgi:CelD/BcsL family acetyltransferase involved in cellulose biosynthesis
MMAAHSVECVDTDGAEMRAAPWRDLCSRAIEGNVFAEPGFLIPAARHLGPRALQFLMVWSDGDKRRLVGVMAIEPPRRIFGVVPVWRSDQAGLAAIVLDRDGADGAFQSAADWLRRERPQTAGLFVPTLAANGETARLLAAFAARWNLPFFQANASQRAILGAARDERARFECALSGRRLKEWRRLRRRLEEGGPLVFRSALEAEAARRASETFLALEPKNWKGRGGAPLGGDQARAAFARSMLANLANEGKARIDSLERAGAPVAMGVVLSSKDRAFYWKTAYDEGFAEFSPGVLLTLDISRKQQDDPKTAATDSCAIEGHPMIERLWTERLGLVDCLVAIGPGGARQLKAWLIQRDLERRLKEGAKRLLFPLLGRKRS